MDVSLSELRELVMDGRPGVLPFMGLQRVGHDWATELNWTEWLPILSLVDNSRMTTTILSLLLFCARSINNNFELKWG